MGAPSLDPHSVFLGRIPQIAGSYFKLGGEGSQILWVRGGGGEASHRVSLAV